jgi:2-hydroxychromene-2-carboxylate isomerase
MNADWYFDFISPYAYFASCRLAELDATLTITPRPILFAQVLKHWGHKGPAEIPAKRAWTYRACTWWAAEHDIPFRFPAAHPFNPLPYLRLSIAAGNTSAAIHTIFAALWTTGVDAADDAVVASLARELGVDRERLADQAVKDALRTETERAIARGLFGVPTLAIDAELFWGADAMDFALAYARNPAILRTDEMQRVSQLPVGASRK